MALQSRAVQGQECIPILAANGLVHGHQLGAVWKGALDLDFAYHFRHARHDFRAAQQLLAFVHQRCHTFALANELQQLRRDQRSSFRVVEQEAARVALLGHKTGVVQDQFVDFPG